MVKLKLKGGIFYLNDCAKHENKTSLEKIIYLSFGKCQDSLLLNNDCVLNI